MVALFDRVAVIDWSAASVPARGTDSIWMATVDGRGCRLENLPTRRFAAERMAGLLATGTTTRTLLGVDFSLGYPAGTAAALGLGRPSWRSMWELLTAEVVDDRRNDNNRFDVAAALNRRLGPDPGPFWGRPARRTLAGLTATKPSPSSLPEWRSVEAELRAQGRRPSSSWQLLGAGCVGSQSLVGIPVLERLRRRAPGAVHVWPFTTGLQAPDVRPGDVVVAEIWPSLVAVDPGAHEVRDAAQVEAVAGHLARLDHAGALAALFAPDVGEAAESVIDEEGWVLGAEPAVVAAVPFAGV